MQMLFNCCICINAAECTSDDECGKYEKCVDMRAWMIAHVRLSPNVAGEKVAAGEINFGTQVFLFTRSFIHTHAQSSKYCAWVISV